MYKLHVFSASLLFLQWFLMPGVPAQVWQGCVDPEKPKNKIRVAQKTRVCFSISNTTNWSAGVAYTRASFEPQADVYSRFHIPNCTSDSCGCCIIICILYICCIIYSHSHHHNSPIIINHFHPSSLQRLGTASECHQQRLFAESRHCRRGFQSNGPLLSQSIL